MNARERERFDALLEAVLASLPDHLHALLEEAPLVVDDAPDPKLLSELGVDADVEILCGLHSGVPITERSHEAGDEGMEIIHLFREGIVDEAGGPGADDADVAREIRITLLHEIGHHFGLDEDDLFNLGYD
jgi:predicted Zn-dependent protease with MMP-like domain